jgi:opacity protein-like surface antigen
MRILRNSILVLVLVLAASVVGAGSAHAYGLSGVGASVGYTSPEDLDGALSVGGHLEFEQADSRLHFVPGMRFWKVNGVSDLDINADALYHFDPNRSVSPYLGAGLGIQFAHRDASDGSDTSVGPNLFGGVRFPASFGHSFVETRFSFANISQFSVLGGMTWNLH